VFGFDEKNHLRLNLCFVNRKEIFAEQRVSDGYFAFRVGRQRFLRLFGLKFAALRLSGFAAGKFDKFLRRCA
jgi:hypothetical protein